MGSRHTCIASRSVWISEGFQWTSSINAVYNPVNQSKWLNKVNLAQHTCVIQIYYLTTCLLTLWKNNRVIPLLTCTHLVAIGLPLALSWKNSVDGFTVSVFGVFIGRLPVRITNLRLKWDRNLRFSCCWCCRTTSNLSWNRAANFFCKLKQNNTVITSCIHQHFHAKGLFLSQWRNLGDKM